MLSELSKNATAAEHIQQTRRLLLEAYDHQDFTFASLLQRISFPRDPSRLPLIEVQFNVERVGAGVAFSGLRSTLEANPKRFVNTDLFLNIVESDNGLLLDCDYNTDLWDAATVEAWLRCFEQAVTGMLANPLQSAREVNLLSHADETALDQWNRTETPFDEMASVAEWFESVAAIRGDSVAAVCGTERISYRELNEKANQLACLLRKQGMGQEVLVGICMERSLRLLISILAVWKAGGACVPLDPQFPRERLLAIAEEIAGPVLLTEEKVAELWTGIPARVLCVDQEVKRLHDAARTNVAPGAGRGASLAYVLFTSGSTGTPKGVQIEHRSLTNLLASMQRVPGITEEDRLVAVTTISFDIAWLELFLPLVSGARLIIATQEEARDPHLLQQVLCENKATMLQATPAGWRMLVLANWEGMPALKMLCGGEALPRELAEKLLTRGKELWNMYGPTETTIWSSVLRIETGSGPVPVGGPIHNTQFYVLDEQKKPVPLGVPGELFIGGAGVARGYLSRPELTAERFVKREVLGMQRRLYRTGDLVRRTAHNTIEFLGRLDHQVKVRGYRIELGDVESALRSHVAVSDCVVVAQAKPNETDENWLVAYLVSTGQEDTHRLEVEIREFLGDKLPGYMHPGAFVFLESLPKTPNGKVDRNALPAPSPANLARVRDRVPPTTVEEKRLARIWRDVLNLDEVGINENIFELGADSLGIFRIATLANQEGLSLMPRHLFQYRTISGVLEQMKQPTEVSAPISSFQVSVRSQRLQNGKAK